MDKLEFLMGLKELLRDLPEADQRRSVDYYAEMIEDRIEEGLSEEEAVAAVGDLHLIAESILSETPAAPRSAPKKRRLRWWEITLLVLGAPVWLSLLIAGAAVLFSVWISLWSGVISLYATAVALAASALGCLLAGFFAIQGGALVIWGTALVCAGLTIGVWLLSNLAAKGMIALTGRFFRGLKRGFAKKEAQV